MRNQKDIPGHSHSQRLLAMEEYIYMSILHQLIDSYEKAPHQMDGFDITPSELLIQQ